MKHIVLIFSFSLFLSFGAYLHDLKNNNIQIIFCDVKQGDATLIIRGDQQILIDGGPKDHVLDCLSKYMPWYDRTIELIIATHPDTDHIEGLIGVIRKFKVLKLVKSDTSKSTTVFEDLESLVQSKKSDGLVISPPKTGKSHHLSDDCKITEINILSEEALQAYRQKYKVGVLTANDESIVLIADCCNKKILLMADAEVKTELAMIQHKMLTDIDILKIGHHGSKSSTGDELLRATQPEYSVISVGKDNRYGHPSPDVIGKLQSFKSKIVRTDQAGDLVFSCVKDKLVLINDTK